MVGVGEFVGVGARVFASAVDTTRESVGVAVGSLPAVGSGEPAPATT